MAEQERRSKSVMSAYRTVAVVSDIHYASAAEQARTAYEMIW